MSYDGNFDSALEQGFHLQLQATNLGVDVLFTWLSIHKSELRLTKVSEKSPPNFFLFVNWTRASSPANDRHVLQSQ